MDGGIFSGPMNAILERNENENQIKNQNKNNQNNNNNNNNNNNYNNNNNDNNNNNENKYENQNQISRVMSMQSHLDCEKNKKFSFSSTYFRENDKQYTATSGFDGTNRR